MTEISYERLVEKALLHVVRDALLSAQKNGLDGNHFYITFQTPSDDVVLSDRLKAAYPEEITIVLQHEYSDLEVSDDAFSVVLSFGNIPEKIFVPFAAIVRFADPFAQFAVSFTPEPPQPEKKKEKKHKPESDQENVVSLNAFRKKK